MESIADLIKKEGIVHRVVREAMPSLNVHPSQENAVLFTFRTNLLKVIRHLRATTSSYERKFILAYYYARNFINRDIHNFISSIDDEKTLNIVLDALIAWTTYECRVSTQ